MTLKKILTESEQVTANLLSKARKAKGVAQWAKLAPLKEKLEGKEQAHIQFTSHNPKTFGKKRTLASKDGALDFLMGYVSPRFFVAPYHLQIINPDLTEEQARDWLRKLGHPSRIHPTSDKSEGPEGDVEMGFCHDSVGSQYPGKQIALFGEVTDTPEVSTKPQFGNPVGDEGTALPPQKGTLMHPQEAVDHPVDPAFVQEHTDAPEQQEGNPQDMLMVCPFGGGSRCREQGGSGSAFHHIHSDSMRAHIEKMAAGQANTELPKMGSFKGEPALFFEHKSQPYVAVPARQEVYAKSGVMYKWSFLSEGPMAQSNPFLAKVMNQMAPRKPVILPQFNVAESVVTIAHDAVPSEDAQLCSFVSNAFQLVKDYFPRPGSVIPLGIMKGEKVFAVVTERSLDFYNEHGEDTYFHAADGLYYAYLDLTGEETPALVLLSFINLFLSHIDTTPLEQQLEKEEAAEAAVTSEEAPPEVPGQVESPVSYASVVKSGDKDYGTLVGWGLKAATVVMQEGVASMLAKPALWESYDLPLYVTWKFSYQGSTYAITNFVYPEAVMDMSAHTPSYRLYSSKVAVAKAFGTSIQAVMSAFFGEMDEPTALAAAGLVGQSFPAGCTVYTVLDGTFDVVMPSPLDAVQDDDSEDDDAPSF